VDAQRSGGAPHRERRCPVEREAGDQARHEKHGHREQAEGSAEDGRGGEEISEYPGFIEAGGHNKEPPPPLCTLNRSNTAHCVDEDAWQANAYFLPKPLGASLPRSSRSLSVPSWRG
jgi:hypothetical protein